MKPVDHAIRANQFAARKRQRVDTERASANAKSIDVEMAEDDDGPGGRVDGDRVASVNGHVSDIAGAAVDGDRGRDGERAIAAGAKATDLGDVTLVDGALE